MADTKIGAYICKGCGLGERLDCDDLATIAANIDTILAEHHQLNWQAPVCGVIKP